MSAQGYFVTGTDTEIGKTYVSVALIHYLCKQGHRVAGLKPLASGSEQTPDGLRNEDALQLAEASNVKLDYNEINRYTFEPAIAPHIAAELANTPIELDKIQQDLDDAAQKADKVIVEAAGGWLVPLNDTATVADLAMQLNGPELAFSEPMNFLATVGHAPIVVTHITIQYGFQSAAARVREQTTGSGSPLPSAATAAFVSSAASTTSLSTAAPTTSTIASRTAICTNLCA